MGTHELWALQPRQHSARAVTDCSVIRFDSAKIDGMIAWDQTANYIMLAIAAQRDLDEDAEWMATLLRSNLFYKVPPINIEQILHRFEPLAVAADDFILRQGEIGDCCYVIKEGEAEVWHKQSSRWASTRSPRQNFDCIQTALR